MGRKSVSSLQIAADREPVICAGRLAESCETGLCFDSIDVEKGTIKSGCASRDMCTEPRCDMVGNQFICCCEHSVCNGKSEGLIKSRLRMWNSGQYFSGPRNALSQETSAEDAEQYRPTVPNTELTDEEMHSTVHSSSEDMIAEATTTLDELANLENAKSRSEQYHTGEPQTVTPVELAKSSSEKHYTSEQQTVAPVEQSTTESTIEEDVGEFDDEGDTAEPSTTLSTILSVHHHTSYTPPTTSEELITYSEDESSTLRSTTAAHVPMTTLSELHDDHLTVAPTDVQDEQYSTTESLLDSRERF
uniref:EB domain-containing protein n=1 Tax=Parascaris equorum TaxID=6256 RepID=A0A914RNY7_PAREQ